VSAATQLPGLKMGALDPDRTQEFGTVAGKTSARALIQHHVAAHPKELTRYLMLKQDEERSDALDLEEVAKAAANAGVPGKVVGANVRGERDRDQIVCLTYEVESGRTGKAAIPYNEKALPASVEAGDNAVAIATAKEHGQPWLPPEVTEQLGQGGGSGEGGGKAIKQLEKRVEELTQIVKSQQDGDDDDPASVEATVTYEPFEGYADANIEEVEARIAEEAEGFPRELLKHNIRQAEEARDTPRKGVMDATEPVELVPAEQPPQAD
jgi:hypothetical protein